MDDEVPQGSSDGRGTCCSTGNVKDEIIAQYIANQNENRDDDFKVEG